MNLCTIAECHTEDGHVTAVTDGWPDECTMFTILIDGYEDTYWTFDEWADEPKLVVGAIFGALKSVVEGTYTPKRSAEVRKVCGKFDV